APYGRPSWSGLLQISLVGIPLKAYPAVRTRDVPTAHLLHADCGQRLGYANPVHGPVDSAAIVKGYDIKKLQPTGPASMCSRIRKNSGLSANRILTNSATDQGFLQSKLTLFSRLF